MLITNMSPISRPKSKKTVHRRSLQKRVQALSHVRKPHCKQKKMTDFFPPAPKLNPTKEFTEENQETTLLSTSNIIQMNTSPQKYGLRPKKTQPRVFYGFEPELKNAISPTKDKETKQLLPKGGATILREHNENVDKIITLFKASKIDLHDNENIVVQNPRSPSKSPAEDVYKPQRNARRIFLKYGSRIPSFNDILKSREELVKFKEDVAYVAELQKNPLPCCDKSKFSIDPEEIEENSDQLNCKHIPLDVLKQLFADYEVFVIGIGNGTISSDRHKSYMQDPFGDAQFHRGGLMFNVSMSAFSTKQKMLLAKLTKKTLSRNNLTFNNQYYFKVVLPELCFKIFTREHKLTEEQAKKYLSNPLLT